MERQKSIIIGKLLGDGTLRKNRKNALLEINHSWKQKEYVFWIYEELINLVSAFPKVRKSGKNRKSCRFTTRSLPCFTRLYERFYINGVKVAPKNLSINPLILSVWFMDDGSKSRDTVYLNTQQFSLQDQETLLVKLKELGLDSTLNRDKKYFRIRLRKSSIERFKSLVEPYVIESMKYKIP